MRSCLFFARNGRQAYAIKACAACCARTAPVEQESALDVKRVVIAKGNSKEHYR